MKKMIVMLVVFIAALAAAGYWYWEAHANSRTVFRFDELTRGRLVATIGSTGTVQAREVVDVGAQVAGRIITIGKDPYTQSGIVDWGSEVEGPVLDNDGKIVKHGTILAQIDPALYAAQVAATEAQVEAAQADLLQKTATLGQATADWGRAEKLFKDGVIAKAEYDQFQAQFEVAKANVKVSKANIGVAKANLTNAKTNLEYATISAPVKGVVIDRRVNVGQTVVASLSAPSLFLIAKDLTKLEVWATVNEVDVSKIRVGTDVKFTVDSLAGRIYHGKVVPQGKLPLRLNAAMNQNVVTYTVVVSVDNSDRALSPYMTANLSFITADHKDVLMVPNAALRWQPAKEQIAPEQRDAYAALRGKRRATTETDLAEQGFVWTAGDDGFVHYMQLKLGPSDGVKTEVAGVVGGGELPEHTPIIIGEGKAGGRSGGANPFSVQMFKASKTKD
jgi:HlyD family secretion protein